MGLESRTDSLGFSSFWALGEPGGAAVACRAHFCASHRKGSWEVGVWEPELQGWAPAEWLCGLGWTISMYLSLRFLTCETRGLDWSSLPST